MPREAPTVVVVDDFPLFRRGIADLLTRNGYAVVGEGSTFEEITTLIHRCKPAAALLDIRLGNKSALAVIPALRTTCPDVRILVLTMYDEPAFRRAAQAAGAHGYVCKRDADTEILIALKSVLHTGSTYFPTAEDVRAVSGGSDSRPVLAPREIEVVRHIARGHTNRAIAEKLHVSIKSVESYRARVMAKLGFTSRVDLVRYALETGLLGTGETPKVDD